NSAMVGAGNKNNISANVPYYEGGMAFWVKFEFNGDDPVFSGLIGCTQVIEDVGREFKDSEGTQFYILKNSDGELRIIRMYYHQAYQSTGGEGGDEGGDVANLWPPTGSGDDPGGGGDAGGGDSPGQNPIIPFLDPKKQTARAEWKIDVKRFRAHEWHHIAVDWNDESVGTPTTIYIDFERVQEGGPFLRQAENANQGEN